MSGLTFNGAVYFRSSLPNASGPPGEAAILALNPQRKERILAVTGWPNLEPGSLNLKVAADVLEALMDLQPAWIEDGSTVVYPASLSHIPKIRIAYLYFLGTAHARGKDYQVLVRRAQNPVPGTVELFASVELRTFFGLMSGDQIKVDMHAI
jgi:hypothetical protein